MMRKNLARYALLVALAMALSWLESMLSAPDQGTGEEGRRKQEAVNALSDIVRRMRAA